MLFGAALNHIRHGHEKNLSFQTTAFVIGNSFGFGEWGCQKGMWNVIPVFKYTITNLTLQKVPKKH
jgi:hypothetical protein